MIDTLYEEYEGVRLPQHIQIQRLHKVIARELTDLQRQTLLAYYFQDKSITQIAQERGVCKSTVCRTLHRAEERVRRFLRY